MLSNIMKIKIAEIFYSIQGEGFFTGRAAIFIRFSGCNLNCSFCDEPIHKLPGTEYNDFRIIEELKQYHPCKFIVLTGGEPTIQSDFSLLVEVLQHEGYFVAVETNGSTRIKCHPDWVTVSPKSDSFIYGDELKIVYQDQDLDKLALLPFKYLYLQPLNYEKEIDYNSVEKCLGAIKKHPKWRLSLQVQKVLGKK